MRARPARSTTSSRRRPSLARAHAEGVCRRLTSSPSWARRWPERRAGSSAARCATSCSTPRGRHRRCLPRAGACGSRVRARSRWGPALALRASRRMADRSRGRMTVDFTPLPGAIEEDLAGRDFTLNAMARPLEGGELVDPFGGQRDVVERTIRAVSQGVFEADPLRLLRAVRLEDELGFRIDAEAERLVRRHAELASQPAGERILGELGAALHRRLPAPRGAGPARRPGRLGGAVRPGSTPLTHPSTDRVRVRGAGAGVADLAPPRQVRPHAARRSSHRPTLLTGACDPSLPARDRAVGPDALAFVGLLEFRQAVVEQARAADLAAPLLRGRRARPVAGPRGRPAARADRRRAAAGTISTKERRWSLSDEKHAEATQACFAASAERMAEHEESRREQPARRFGAFEPLRRRARAGRGRAGRAACVRRRTAWVKEVVAVDVVPEVLAEGRSRAEQEFPERDVRRGRRRGPSVRGRIVRPRRSRAHAAPRLTSEPASSPSWTRVIGFSGRC